MDRQGATSPSPVQDVTDYDLLFDCVHCGLCAEACPTYIVTRCEMDSPRGRIYLMKSITEGRIELDDDAARHLDLCLGCRGCETACPSGVHYGQLIEGARSFVERHHTRGLVDRIKRSAVSAIFPYPNRLEMILAPLKLVDRLGDPACQVAPSGNPLVERLEATLPNCDPFIGRVSVLDEMKAASGLQHTVQLGERRREIGNGA